MNKLAIWSWKNSCFFVGWGLLQNLDKYFQSGRPVQSLQGSYFLWINSCRFHLPTDSIAGLETSALLSNSLNSISSFFLTSPFDFVMLRVYFLEFGVQGSILFAEWWSLSPILVNFIVSLGFYDGVELLFEIGADLELLFQFQLK